MKIKMKIVATEFNYDFYIGTDSKGKTYYNVVPAGHAVPNGGYYSHKFICNVKGVPNLFIS